MPTLVTDGPSLHDEAARIDGTWRITRPFDGLADASIVHLASQRIASLDADRWVAAHARPEFGLDAPRGRVVARFEGAGPESADGGTNAGNPHVREYTVSLGAAARGGGVYATL